MASEKKRVATGLADLNDFFTKTVMELPEFVNNPEAIPEYLKGAVTEIAGLGFKVNRKGYHDAYIPGLHFIRKQKHKLMKRMAEETGLSTNSIEKLGMVLGGAAKVAFEGEAEIPPQTVTFTGGDVTVGGSVNPKKDEYRVTGDVNLDLDPFGLKEGYLTAGATASSTPEGVSIDQARIGAEAPFLGGTLSGEVSGNLDEQQASLGYTLPLKKGGKVRKKTKKRKNKKYAKGCVVRAARY